MLIKNNTLLHWWLLLFLAQKLAKSRTKYQLLVIWSRKQIMMLKYLKSRKSILLLLVIINLQESTWDKHKKKELVNKSDVSNLVKNSELNTKLVTLATKNN